MTNSLVTEKLVSIHAIAQLYKWLIFCPWQKKIQVLALFWYLQSSHVFAHSFYPWNLSYEIIQFEVNKNVFFTSNEIIDGKWIDARAITMYTGIFVIKLEYHNKL